MHDFVFRSVRQLFCMCAVLLLAACTDKAEPPAYKGVKIGKPYQVFGQWYEPKHEASYDEIGMASWYGPGFHGNQTANGEAFDQHAYTAAHRTLPMPSLVRVTNLENGRSIIVRVNDRGPFARNRIIDVSKATAKKLDMIRAGTAKVRVQYLDQETEEYIATLKRNPKVAEQQLASLDPNAIGAREAYKSMPKFQMHSSMFEEPVRASAMPQDTAVTATSLPPPSPGSSMSTLSASYQPATASVATQSAFHVLKVPEKKLAIAQDTEIFFHVQAGTFTQSDNAFRLSRRIEHLAPAEVMEISRDNKSVYRVLMGPFITHEDAQQMQKKLIALGIADTKIIQN